MCFHHRLIFACGHFVWLNIARECDVEKAFNKGDTAVGCSQMWSSGMCTRKIGKKCRTCGKKEVKTKGQVAEIRRRIEESRELVEKITSRKSPSPGPESSSRTEENEKEKEKEKKQLIEAGIVFDDELETQSEDFSPFSSPAIQKMMLEYGIALDEAILEDLSPLPSPVEGKFPSEPSKVEN